MYNILLNLARDEWKKDTEAKTDITGQFVNYPWIIDRLRARWWFDPTMAIRTPPTVVRRCLDIVTLKRMKEMIMFNIKDDNSKTAARRLGE
jgi:hypothetical protein